MHGLATSLKRIAPCAGYSHATQLDPCWGILARIEAPPAHRRRGPHPPARRARHRHPGLETSRQRPGRPLRRPAPQLTSHYPQSPATRQKSYPCLHRRLDKLSDRVLSLPSPPRGSGRGRPFRHGPEFTLADAGTWPQPAVATSTQTARYGTAVACSWDRLHSRLTSRGAWQDHQGELPVIEGTLIRLQVEHLPGDRDPRPVWLWSSAASARTRTWICCGRRSCAALISSTRSGCSSRCWAGPRRRSATRPPPTGRPG